LNSWPALLFVFIKEHTVAHFEKGRQSIWHINRDVIKCYWVIRVTYNNEI